MNYALHNTMSAVQKSCMIHPNICKKLIGTLHEIFTPVKLSNKIPCQNTFRMDTVEKTWNLSNIMVARDIVWHIVELIS